MQHHVARADFAGVDKSARYDKGGHCGSRGVDNAGVVKSALWIVGQMKDAHPNLYVFLGHLHRVTLNNQAHITRLDREACVSVDRRPRVRGVS